LQKETQPTTNKNQTLYEMRYVMRSEEKKTRLPVMCKFFHTQSLQKEITQSSNVVSILPVR